MILDLSADERRHRSIRSDKSLLFRLLQARLEKEESDEEVKELQEKVSAMKQQIPEPGHTQALSQVQ